MNFQTLNVTYSFEIMQFIDDSLKRMHVFDFCFVSKFNLKNLNIKFIFYNKQLVIMFLCKNKKKSCPSV